MEMPGSEVALLYISPCTYSALLDWARVVVETYYLGYIMEGCHCLWTTPPRFKKVALLGDLRHAMTCHGLVILALAYHVELQNGHVTSVAAHNVVNWISAESL